MKSFRLVPASEGPRREFKIATVPVVWTASGEDKLKTGSRLLVSPFPEITFIPSCCGVL